MDRVHPIKNWHMFCYGHMTMRYLLIHLAHLPIFFRVASLALGQSYDCPSAGEVILKNMGIIGCYI